MLWLGPLNPVVQLGGSTWFWAGKIAAFTGFKRLATRLNGIPSRGRDPVRGASPRPLCVFSSDDPEWAAVFGVEMRAGSTRRGQIGGLTGRQAKTKKMEGSFWGLTAGCRARSSGMTEAEHQAPAWRLDCVKTDLKWIFKNPFPACYSVF